MNQHQLLTNEENKSKKPGQLSDFTFLQKIGEGSYSQVHKVKKKSDGKEYALKKVRIDGLKPKEKENALNEVRILASINHPHIISYKDTFFDEKSNSLCIVMEFAQDGDVQRRIDIASKSKQHFPEKEIWKMFIHCLRGLKVLHGMKILHRDIKCANIFISKDGNYKLGDLNVSKVAKKGLVYTQTGTPYYASPEVWRDEPYDFKSDIWSLGCIIYELCALKPPFRAKNMEGLYQRVQKGVYERIPRVYSDELSNVLGQCMKVNSSLRPSCKALIANPVVQRNTLNTSQENNNDNYNTQEFENQNLLQTIKVPKNMKLLADKLPKAKYEDTQNMSFDNADPRNLHQPVSDKRREFPSQQRQNKIQSALPNYTDVRKDKSKSENVQLPSILQNSNNSNNMVNSNNQNYDKNSLPKINSNGTSGQKYNQEYGIRGHENRSNVYNNDPYAIKVKDGRQHLKDNSRNYHYVEGDSMSSHQQIITQKQRKIQQDLLNMQNQLQKKEQFLVGMNKGSQHSSQNQLPKGQRYDIYKNNQEHANQYRQQYNSPSSYSRNNENSYSRIANLYENQKYNYMPSPVSYKKSKNMTPFNPILQSQQQQSPDSSRPVWWG